MNSTKITSQREIEEALSQGIERGMKFRLEEKNKLGKKEVEREDEIEIMGMKNFKFKKGDVIVIDETFETQNNMQKIKFHIKRKGEEINDEKGGKVTFEFSRIIFVQRFRKISDMEDVVKHTQRAVLRLIP